jgi:Mn-dependent DtxR family transcriptional regulator
MGTANFDIVGSILKIFSNEEQIDLIKIIANNGGGRQFSTPEFLSRKFDLNKRDFNSRIERLMNLGLVDMINNHYCLTQLGKEIYDSLIMIENATREFLIQ